MKLASMLYHSPACTRSHFQDITIIIVSTNFHRFLTKKVLAILIFISALLMESEVECVSEFAWTENVRGVLGVVSESILLGR